MLELVRKHPRFFLALFCAALALRLFFIFYFPGVVDDSRLYANVAENWLHHHIYGVTDSGHVVPTLSRLPGYPAFLAAIFAIFGDDSFRAVLFVQLLFDLGTCFLIADLARRVLSDRAAQAAFALAAVCPFLANYAAAALTETLEIFFTTLALDLVIIGLKQIESTAVDNSTRAANINRIWICCGLSIGAAILLRPDGGILLAAIGFYLLYLLAKAIRSGSNSAIHIFRAGVLVALGAVAPLVPWTLRNLHTLHRFEPLAPRYANDSDELVMTGFNRWTKTWMADYVSVQEIYWNVPGDAIDVARLPGRAFDSPEQRAETATLFADYNHDRDMTPELDARFAKLAATRIHAAPLRYYLWLPVIRIVDMWMRPRTELLPPDPRWWEFNDNPLPLATSIVFGVLNFIYVLAAIAGFVRICAQNRDKHAFFGIGLFIFFLLLRSAFLGSLENPEPRYTLECYPVVFMLVSSLFTHR